MDRIDIRESSLALVSVAGTPGLDPDEHLALRMFFAVTLGRLKGGELVPCALSPLYTTVAGACRAREEQSANFPHCAIVSVTVVADAAVDGQLTEFCELMDQDTAERKELH